MPSRQNTSRSLDIDQSIRVASLRRQQLEQLEQLDWQVFDALPARIRSGTYQSVQHLPSESGLASECCVFGL